MIEVIAGTNRPGSNTLKVANIIKGLYEAAGEKAQVVDLGKLPQEIYAPTSYGEKPAGFATFQDRILAAKGLHVVVPEYNGSYPGALKYFIDMLKFPESFEHRPVAYTGVAAGLWGGFRAVEQLQLVFGYRNAYNLPERVWIPGIHAKLNEAGTEITDAKVLDMLKGQVKEFVAFTKRNEGIAPCKA
ncbi:MAG: NAD(P)H-dependent oxidoreductase [Candidatus Sumerlaeia bacterium]|nr:NAD(P)H-dependent oxidoreductase [Candidatus Sumerlaeia bacterium]